VIEITVASALIVLYLVLNRENAYEVQVAVASVFMVIYLAIYLYVPPKLGITATHLGQIFGFVPGISFGAILFPELNARFPAGVTRFCGWLGLTVSFSILCVLKVFVW
jgi:hypothetical protein